MINLILISLLLHYLGLYIFKPKMDSFYCGIGGYIGNNFNKYKFNSLGLYNDSRGGDSCGIVTSNEENVEVYYGHDKTKLYKNFVELGGLKDTNLESPNFALLHCRKASVGGISLATAQPVVIRNANNEVIFAMIHNGTLVNYKELAVKYNVDFMLTETDSQIFCKTVFKAGYGVLAEYDGAGAFVFWDNRDGSDTIKIFKGASLFYENDKDIYIERPLYCIKEENSYWFSSMEESLEFINDTNAKVENVKSNTLFTIKNGKVIAEDYIDRSKRKQSDKLQTNWEKQRLENAKKFNNGQTNFSGHGGYDAFEEWPEFGQDNGVYGDRDYGQKSFGSPISEKTDRIKIAAYKNKNKITFNEDGLYYINNILCDGIIDATPSGFVDISTVQKKSYYFVSGVLIKSYFDYLCARQFVAQNFQYNEDDCIEMYLAAYSPTPVPWTIEDDKNRKFIEFYSYNEIIRDTELYTGIFEPYFSFTRNRYILRNGDITWRYEYLNSGSFYVMNLEQTALDEQILSGKLSKNQIKKMIRKNLRETYARN